MPGGLLRRRFTVRNPLHALQPMPASLGGGKLERSRGQDRSRVGLGSDQHRRDAPNRQLTRIATESRIDSSRAAAPLSGSRPRTERSVPRPLAARASAMLWAYSSEPY